MSNIKKNPLDQFSKPLDQRDTKLSRIISLNARDSKKGRLFIPIYDERLPLEFQVKYTYLSKFLEKGNTSGNHYHQIKKEILIPLQGKFEIVLEDINTKEIEIINVSSEENKAIYIKTGIAHKVKSLEDTGILLVLASNHSTVEDEHEYLVG